LYDFTVTLAILWVFRPRYWPDYFYLSIFEQPLLRNQQETEERLYIAPFIVAEVNDTYRTPSDSSFCSNQNILILNPDSSLEHAGRLDSLCGYEPLPAEPAELPRRNNSNTNIHRRFRTI
jgi:hypothetical protein